MARAVTSAVIENVVASVPASLPRGELSAREEASPNAKGEHACHRSPEQIRRPRRQFLTRRHVPVEAMHPKLFAGHLEEKIHRYARSRQKHHHPVVKAHCRQGQHKCDPERRRGRLENATHFRLLPRRSVRLNRVRLSAGSDRRSDFQTGSAMMIARMITEEYRICIRDGSARVGKALKFDEEGKRGRIVRKYC